MGGEIRTTARYLGISPGTVLNWRNRAANISSLKYLKRRSTLPHTIQGNVLDAVDKERIVTTRNRTRYGAAKIKSLLKLNAHTSTVHRCLKNYHLTIGVTAYRRPRYQETIHMHAKNVKSPGKLQMDVKYVTPELSGLAHTCYLYAIMDIFSRMKLGIIYPLLDQGFAIKAVELLTPLFPFKSDFVQTDNGLEFQRRFHDYVLRLGYDHHYIHKSSPNENAVIERSFRTDEEEFFFWRMRKPKSMLDLNIQYQTYLWEYNNERPHMGLSMMTPVEKLRSVQNV